MPYGIHDIILPVCLMSFQKSFQFCLSPLPCYNRQSDALLPQPPQSVPNYGVFALSPLRERNFGPMPPENHSAALLWSPNKDGTLNMVYETHGSHCHILRFSLVGPFSVTKHALLPATGHLHRCTSCVWNALYSSPLPQSDSIAPA